MSAAALQLIDGVAVLVYAEAGERICAEHDIDDLIGAAWEQQAQMLVIPVARLAPEFFRLQTGLAGALAQKFANYRLRLAIVGDMSSQLGQSEALRDFVRESNRGSMMWFVPDEDALRARLAA
jgi:hypothetical protein